MDEGRGLSQDAERSVPVLGHLAARQLDHGGEDVHQAGGLMDHVAGRQEPGPPEYPRDPDPAFPAGHAFATWKGMMPLHSQEMLQPRHTPRCTCVSSVCAQSLRGVRLFAPHRWSPRVLVVKHPPANAGDVRDVGSIPGLGRSPGRGQGNPLQYSCLGNPIDRGA